MNKTEPLIAEIPVPMHESKEAFEEGFKSEQTPDDHDISTALRGIEKVDSHLKRINDVRSKIMNDRTLNKAAKKAEFLKFVNKIEDKIQADIQRVTQIVDNKTSKIHETISQPVSEEAAGRFSGEIRKHVASLEELKRVPFVKKLVDKEDYESASAVLGSKYFLAGLSEDMQQTLLGYYREKRFSDHMKINKAMQKIGDSMLHKISMISRYKKKWSSSDTVAALESRRAREESMQ